MRPRDLKYSETHEWVKVDGTTATVGITDYAVKQLSDLVSIELPDVGEAVDLESEMGEIESVKTVAELISPISGKVVAINKEVVENIDLLKTNAYEDGWLVRIQMKSAKDLDHLMSAQDYDEYLKSLEEEHADEEEEEEEEPEEEEDDDADDDEG